MDQFRIAIEAKVAGLNVNIEEVAGQIELRPEKDGLNTIIFVHTCDLSVSASRKMAFPTPSYDVGSMKKVSDLFAPSMSGYILLGVACKNVMSAGSTRSYWQLRFRD